MSIIKRISTSLFASIDQIVGDIENHDALIKAAITEQRKKIAGAKVQLNRIKSSKNKVAGQIADLKQKEKRWEERAVNEVEQNEQQALACLQRRKSVREQVARLRDARTGYQQTADKMETDIARCERELRAMSQKHEVMRARQSSADALNVINEVSGSTIDDLETSFERWETKITQHEIDVDTYDLPDVLEQEYISQENEAELRMELAELIKKENDHDDA